MYSEIFNTSVRPQKPPKPTKKTIANYKSSMKPRKPTKPTAKSIANYQMSIASQKPPKRIPNSVRYQGKITNKQRNHERMDKYLRPREPESVYNLRGKTPQQKQKVFDRMDYHYQLEKNNRERARQKEIKNQEFREHFFRNGKELKNKAYRTKIRKQIGNNLRRRFELRENVPEFNTVNNIVFKPTEKNSSNSFVMINNVPTISPTKISPRRGIFSRMRGKRRPTRKRSSVGGGHKINILEKKSMHKRRNSPIYKGLGSDLIMSYIYLMIKHKKLLSIAIGNKATLKKNPNPTYIGLVYSHKNNKNNLEYDGGMKALSNFMLNCKTRFFMVPISMEYPNSGAHFNLLLGDTKTGVLERFEPYGSVVNEKVHDNFDKDIKSFLKTHDIDLKYKKPKDFIQQKGFQELEEVQIDDRLGSVRRDDYRGYCGMWSIWFVDMRMRNPEMSSKELLALSLKKMKGKNFRKFIRNYTNFLVEMRKIIMEKTDKDCRKNNNGKSPDYDFFKVCVSKFIEQHLDEYF
jgi:hypothetical protein